MHMRSQHGHPLIEGVAHRPQITSPSSAKPLSATPILPAAPTFPPRHAETAGTWPTAPRRRRSVKQFRETPPHVSAPDNLTGKSDQLDGLRKDTNYRRGPGKAGRSANPHQRRRH